ncbi:MAG TPA: rhomboid family intramembrane serine protease [Pseudonocardiaceae bacterium]|jgi:membrane associated rhomboid family serine protease|nr:rhomboid family intramembrane serine protease [Pseudonocardiaceae bacterium]
MASPVCVRHPGRETGVRCTRCDRPACAACLREAPVGYQCVDCVAHSARSQPRTSAIPGEQPTGRSVVMPILIAINVAVFVVTVVQAGSLSNNTSAALFQQWALQPEAVAQGAWWQLLTSGFLHIGPLHIAFNMIALWVIGRDLEQVLGRVRFLVVYLVSLLGGSLAVFVFANPASDTAGASGAVFGLMGGLAVVLMRLRLSPRPALTIILLNVIISFAVPNISILGHLGGLAAGAAVTAAMVYTPQKAPPRRSP